MSFLKVCKYIKKEPAECREKRVCSVLKLTMQEKGGRRERVELLKLCFDKRQNSLCWKYY
jgi:hypothetical protein